MFGCIQYTTTQTSTPNSPISNGDVFYSSNIFADSLPAGSMQSIFLRWGYTALDPNITDQRSISQSASGVVQVTNFLTTQGYKFGIEFVNQDRSLSVDEYSLIDILIQELVDGTPIRWYPDWNNFPNEYFSCIANKRPAQQRQFNRNLWQFEFDFIVLNNVQIPSTVPAFVM